jgi:LPS export ABC transporter protein LptC
MSPRRIAKLLGTIGAIVLGIILLVTVIVVRHRSASERLAKAAIGLAPGALLHARNFHWTQMKGDQSQWVLKAADASYSDDRTSLVLLKPELTMVAKDGKHVDLTAGNAKLILSGNHIKNANMAGGVIVHYGDFVLTSEQADFAPDDDRLDAPGPVQIQNSEMTVTGIGLSGSPKTEVFQLHQQVNAHITPRQKSDKPKAS